MKSSHRIIATLPLVTLSSLTLCVTAGSASADPLPLPAPLPTLSAPELPPLTLLPAPLPTPLPTLVQPAPAPSATPAPAPSTSTTTPTTTTTRPVARPAVAPRPEATSVKAAAAHQPISEAALAAASFLNAPAQQRAAGPAVAPMPALVFPRSTPVVQAAQAAGAGQDDDGLPTALVVLASLLALSAGAVNVAVRR